MYFLSGLDNSSDDDTENLILKWQDRLPLTYLFEPRPGKSIALNS